MEHRQREDQHLVQGWGFRMIDIDPEERDIVELVLMGESILAFLVEGRKLGDKKPVEVGHGEDRNLMRLRIHRLVLQRQHYLARLHCHGECCCVLVRHGEGTREGDYDVPVPVPVPEE